MDGTNKLNYSSSFSRRNSYVTNAADIISPSIKKQLKEYESNSETETVSDPENVEEYSDQGSEGSRNSEDFEHLKSNAYSYVPKEFETHSFSDDYDHDHEHDAEEHEQEEVTSSSNEGDEYERGVEEDYGVEEQDNHSTQVPPLNLENMKNSYKSKTKLNNKSNLQTDSSYLNKIFSNLEKNLSDVRIEYQVSLSNSAIESSVRRKNCRLTHSNSISSSKSNSNNNRTNTTTNNNTNKENTTTTTSNNTKSNFYQRGSKEFDLNKWFDELPEGLKNFIELESSSRDPENQETPDHSEQKTQPRQNLRKMGSRNMYLQNITNPLRKQPLESSSDNQHEQNNEEDEGYINILKKDYIEPIKEVFNEDLKNDFTNLKNELVELYNKSPKILQDLMNSSDTLSKFKSKEETESNKNPKETEEETDREKSNNLNLYYLETNRNNGYVVNLNKTTNTGDQIHYNTESFESGKEKETVLKAKKDINKFKSKPDSFKVYNIFDKYECFDITDQPKLTHVSSFDISRNDLNQNLENNPKLFGEDDYMDEEDEKKVVKSIGEYNIGFLSNLSRVNEKYQLLKEYQPNSNLIKPWFLNPLNEKLQSQAMCNQKQSESDRFNRNREDKKYVINNKNNDENIKYIINKENENIKYLIDENNTELPNKDFKNQDKERYTTLYQLESYYNNVEFDPNDSDRNKIYDPILHFKNYEDKKKKSINNTDWATFGRPLVKRIH